MQWLLALFEQHIWTSKVLMALIIVSPKIFSTIAALLVQWSIERAVKSVTARRNNCQAIMTDLERATVSLEQHQLLRASFLMMLNATHAELDWKLKIDRFYRLNALGAVRCAVTFLYPDEWQARIKPYEDLVNADYGAEKISEIQEIETGFDLQARGKLTTLQSELNDLSERKDSLESRKTRISFVLDAIGWILTIVVFFVEHR